MNKTHQLKAIAISEQVKLFYERKKSFRIFHGSTNSTRTMSFKSDEMVDISKLDKVLSINPQTKTAIVEPNVPMDTLVKHTLKYGLIPPVVMEFPGITVGGAIQGNGGESSSFKWGTFNQTFNWFEIVTGDGTIVKASRAENTDLFQAIPGTAGTIGILTAAETKLIPAKRFVNLDYRVALSFHEAKKEMKNAINEAVDFVDGIMFSKNLGVVIVGELSNKPLKNIEKFTRAHDQWYYLHVQDALHKNAHGWSESVPLKDYLFRYDRGAFWVGRFAFNMFKVPYTRFMRWVLDPILHTRKLYQALQESGASQEHIVQDLVLPEDKFITFANFLDRELNTYPLWLCPMLVDNSTPFQLNNIDAKSIINVGVWGDGIKNYETFIQMNQKIEKQVLTLGGKKWSYAHSYFNEKDFWSMYDKKRYDTTRTKYAAENLPTIYDKLTVKTQQDVNKKKALLKTIFGIAKLRINK